MAACAETAISTAAAAEAEAEAEAEAVAEAVAVAEVKEEEEEEEEEEKEEEEEEEAAEEEEVVVRGMTSPSASAAVPASLTAATASMDPLPPAARSSHEAVRLHSSAMALQSPSCISCTAPLRSGATSATSAHEPSSLPRSHWSASARRRILASSSSKAETQVAMGSNAASPTVVEEAAPVLDPASSFCSGSGCRETAAAARESAACSWRAASLAARDPPWPSKTPKANSGEQPARSMGTPRTSSSSIDGRLPFATAKPYAGLPAAAGLDPDWSVEYRGRDVITSAGLPPMNDDFFCCSSM